MKLRHDHGDKPRSAGTGLSAAWSDVLKIMSRASRSLTVAGTTAWLPADEETLCPLTLGAAVRDGESPCLPNGLLLEPMPAP